MSFDPKVKKVGPLIWQLQFVQLIDKMLQKKTRMRSYESRIILLTIVVSLKYFLDKKSNLYMGFL